MRDPTQQTLLLCASFVAMNSRLPMGLPRTTTPCWAAGMAPVQQDALGPNSSRSPGGSSPALFHARVLPRCTWMLGEARLPYDGKLACCVLGGPCDIDVVKEHVECVGRVKAGPGLN